MFFPLASARNRWDVARYKEIFFSIGATELSEDADEGSSEEEAGSSEEDDGSSEDESSSDEGDGDDEA